MSGIGFASKGTAGAVANTAFMPPMPTRFTLCVPLGLGGNGSFFQGVQIDNQIAANKVSLWHICNPSVDFGSGPNAASCTLGASVSAPDGTNTATHLIEASMSATSSTHRMQCGMQMGSAGTGGSGAVVFKNMRNAVIVKAAERTRIKLTTMGVESQFFTDGFGGASSMGASVVFDLAGGQIGVPAYIFNGTGAPFGDTRNPSIGQVSITPVGSGWYLCFIDTTFPTGFLLNYLVTQLVIDNGSGTGAESVTYVGDGSSGVNVWTSSFLPKPCWDQFSNGVCLFDDFNSSSTIDFNDTRAPGFNWYLHGVFPHEGFRATDSGLNGNFRAGTAADFNLSGSVLEQKQASEHYFCSAATAIDLPGGGNGVWVGKYGFANVVAGPQSGTWQVPFLVEFQLSRNTPTANPQNYAASDTSCWTFGCGDLMRDSSLNPTGFGSMEMDWTEASDLPEGLMNVINWQLFPHTAWSSFASVAGAPAWESGWLYNQNPPFPSLDAHVTRGGVHYLDATANNRGNDPALTSPTNWTTVTDNVTTRNSPDLTQFHTQQAIMTRPTHDDPGWLITFFDGIPCNCNRGMQPGTDNSVTTFDPTMANYPNKWAQDHFPILVGAPYNASLFLDYVRVTQ